MEILIYILLFVCLICLLGCCILFMTSDKKKLLNNIFTDKSVSGSGSDMHIDAYNEHKYNITEISTSNLSCQTKNNLIDEGHLYNNRTIFMP